MTRTAMPTGLEQTLADMAALCDAGWPCLAAEIGEGEGIAIDDVWTGDALQWLEVGNGGQEPQAVGEQSDIGANEGRRP